MSTIYDRKFLFDGKPKVQLSLDLQRLEDAMPTAEIAVKAASTGWRWEHP